MLSFESFENKKKKPLILNCRETPRGDKVVYRTNEEIYQNINIIRSLHGKSVFLVSSNITKCTYVMKIFPHRKGHPQLNFINESRFLTLKHPNIIKNLYSIKQKDVILKDSLMKISYIIREHASNGNLLDFIQLYSHKITEKIVRTYFRQLIEGLEYLHDNGIAHMDLKLENLLIDQDFVLRICDFDLAHYKTDILILSGGSRYFRAPEVLGGSCTNPKAADIFSAGIVLFSLYTRGVLPQFEDEKINLIDFASLLYNDLKMFWAHHANAQKQNNISFDEDFKELFISMMQLDPKSRSTIEIIKGSRWYNGDYYSCEELKSEMRKCFKAKDLEDELEKLNLKLLGIL